MKKLWVAMLVAGAGFCAQAYTYHFTMTCADIPMKWEKLSDEAIWYLVDTTMQPEKGGTGNGTVLVWGQNADYTKGKYTTDTAHSQTTIKIGNTTYDVLEHTITADGSYVNNFTYTNPETGDAQKAVTFAFVFNENSKDLKAYYGVSGVKSLDNLKAVIYDPNGQGTQEIVMNPVGFTGYSAQPHFDAGVALDIPEPTSALLVLVGMAGLALRRRRAA